MDNAIEIGVESASESDSESSGQQNPLLEQMAGKGRGRVFELSIDKISLGREEANDIVISDESVSREHARIERGPDGTFVLFDNNSKNGVSVNGNKVDAIPLSHGDIIQMGHFVFRFRVPGSSALSAKQQEMPAEFAPEVGAFQVRAPANRRPLVYGVLVLVLVGLYFMNAESETEKKSELSGETAESEKFKPAEVPKFVDPPEGKVIPGLADPLTKDEKELGQIEQGDSSVKEAEAFFRKGQRDYFNKDYHRAIDNFSSAISIFRKHPLAEYYRALTIHDAEVEAQKNREIGLKYYESLQYNRAIYHLQEAVALLSHSTGDKKADQAVAECKKYIELAKRKLKAAEMYP